MDPDLFNAALGGELEEVRRLIGSGATVNYAEPTVGFTSLHIASANGHKDVAELLLRNGAKVDQARTIDGCTPIIVAAFHGQVAVAEVLLKHGAKLDLRDSSGKTALDWARQCGKTEVIRLFETHKRSQEQAAEQVRLANVERERLLKQQTIEKSEADKRAREQAESAAAAAKVKAEADKRAREQAESSAAAAAEVKAEADRLEGVRLALERERLALEKERLEADKRAKASQILPPSPAPSSIPMPPAQNINMKNGGGGGAVTTTAAAAAVGGNVGDTKRAIYEGDWSCLAMDDDDESSVLGEGSTCKVVKADYINPYTRFSIKVAVKVFLAKAGCTNVDAELAKKYAFCKNEAEILLEIESKLGAQSTDRMTQVIGIVNGKLPSSFLNWLGRTNRLGVGLIMRLEAGGSMSDFLSSSKLQSYRMLDRVSLLLQLSRSVAEIHEVDVVHGDIKPSNVLISEHYPPLLRLSDFGEAKIRHNSLADSTLVHTASNHGTPL